MTRFLMPAGNWTWGRHWGIVIACSTLFRASATEGRTVAGGVRITQMLSVPQLIELIESRTGLRVPERDTKRLLEAVEHRRQSLGLADPEEYLALLAKQTLRSRLEWHELAALVTTGESYFFRDEGQMDVLRTQLLPELIRRHARDRRLRLWSAGCSTGEEPYSLAILLHELLPDWRSWDVHILGTDINERALHRAQQARYREWSLRRVTGEVRSRYFRRRDGLWELTSELRTRVHFRAVNLLSDTILGLPESGSMDLILCRNVFIYFSPAAITHALRKLERALTKGGYLLVGHGELTDQDLGGLERLSYAHTLVYRRSSETRRKPSPAPLSRTAAAHAPVDLPSPRPVPVPRARSPETPSPANDSRTPPFLTGNDASDPADEVQRFLAAGKSQDAAALADRLLSETGTDCRLLCLAAEAWGNLGQLDRAEQYCRQAVEFDALAAAPHYLLAQLAAARGQQETAKQLLKRVLYLDPQHVAAYLDLAEILGREGNETRARSLRRSALEMLAALPADRPLAELGGVTAAELAASIRKTGEATA